MKFFSIPILSVTLVILSFHIAFALEFKINGNWVMSFGYGANGQFQGLYRGHEQTGWGKGQDNFEPVQRMQLQFQMIASENLSGTAYFETGDSVWGKASTGSALGSDGKTMKFMTAFIDWKLPSLPVQTRMGLQSIKTPALASGNYVFSDNATAILVTVQPDEKFAVTSFWARPYNDNYQGWQKDGIKNYQANYLDNIDTFGLTLPLTLDELQIIPWGMFALLGPNSFRGEVAVNDYPFGNIANIGNNTSYYMSGMFPAGGARHRDFSSAANLVKLNQYGTAWWAGLTGEFAFLDPLSIAFDFEYGSVTRPENGRLARSGWFASIELEYQLDWLTSSLYGWYGSGDDANPSNGSERLPALDPDDSINYSYFAFDGSPWIERCAVIGHNLAGTWGTGVRFSNISFINDLTHMFRINLIGGTNSPEMAKKMSLNGLWANGNILYPANPGAGAELGMPGIYLTQRDYALELGSTTNYQLYENFLICFEAAYVFLWLDASDSVWGARHKLNEPIPAVKDAWNLNLSFIYSF